MYKALHKHEFVFHIGDPGDYFYMIFKGTADIYVVKRLNKFDKSKPIRYIEWTINIDQYRDLKT